MSSPEGGHELTDVTEVSDDVTEATEAAEVTGVAEATGPTDVSGTTEPSEAAEVLRRVFGYDSFRGAQREIVDHVVGGGDALVLMSTGSGKSLCYQIPSLVREGVGVVVSPLIALMQDQVDALTALGVRAGFLHEILNKLTYLLVLQL